MSDVTGDPMLADDRMLRGGAHWCDQHQRWECTRKAKSTGVRCHFLAIRGLDRCRMHAGEKAEVAKAKGAAITAWSALSGEPAVSATQAVLGMLQMSWLRVHLYARLLNEQVDAAQDAREDGGFSGRGAGGVGPGAGLVGHTFSGVKDIGVFATGEAVRGLAQLEAAERDRCVRYAKTAHDMGIAEAQVEIAKRQADIFAAAFMRMINALDLTLEQRTRAAERMTRELQTLETVP